MTPIARTFTEMVLVLASGIGIGLVVNESSPDGLDLQRDYFPKAAVSSQPAATTGQSSAESAAPPPTGLTGQEPATADPAPGPATDEAPLDPAVLERLASKGLRAATFAETRALYEDPMYAYEAYVFIDARDDDHYGEGHIPGAYQFDHFRADRYQEQMMQIIPTAMSIVVYCNGGDCEDSESAALFLLGLGADPSQLAVYTGGITQWRDQHMPVELGARNSGDLEEQSP